MPLPEVLKKVRAHVAENHAELRKLIRTRTVRDLYGQLQGEQLTRPPKGYLPDHPAADLVRFKQMYYYVELPPELATSKMLQPTILKHFRAIAPFLEFLNRPLRPQRKHLIPDF